MAKLPDALSIGFEDLLINGRESPLQPGEKGGAKIETDGRIIIDDI